MTNKLTETEGRTKFQLAGALQDMWHYAALVSPAKTGPRSTFEGEREYQGLPGVINAYNQLQIKIEQWELDCLPAFSNLQLPDAYAVNQFRHLKAAAHWAMRAILTVARDNGIDAYTGEIIA